MTLRQPNASRPDHDPPSRTLESGLIVATWNIREFGRSLRSLYSVHRVTALLGSDWDHLVTDVTFGTQGNSERMVFLYDRRKVRFAGLAARVRTG